jgi:hypothetical protein
MSLYCPGCRIVASTDSNICAQCGAQFLCCSQCGANAPKGAFDCPTCTSKELSRSNVASIPAELVPDLPPIGGHMVVSPRVATVVERYDAGRHGVNAEVRIPAGDVAIMNDLGAMVAVLHTMAARLNGFVGHTEHTRQLIRSMRILATDIQDEIETRRGPQG